MVDKKLERLAGLGEAFKVAVNSGVFNATNANANIAMRQKFFAAVTPQERGNAQAKLRDILNESMQYRPGDEPDDEFVKKKIDVIELNAEFVSRVVPIAELASFLPEELKNKEDAAAFRSLNAPILASLCEFKHA